MEETNRTNTELHCQKCQNVLREYHPKCTIYLMEGCGHYTCYSCFDDKMYLCETCENSEFENLENLKKRAICSDCIIKKHMRKGHQTVDFFPYLSAHQFSQYSTEISNNSEKIKKSHELLKESISQFDVLSKRVTENMDMLTDMARRSKSSKYQIEAVERMGLFINESATINNEMDSEVKRKTAAMQKNLTKLEEWYATRTDSCVEDSETIKLPSI